MLLHTGTFLPSVVSYSENDVNGTRHRFAGPSHRFQCMLEVLRMFVTPLSGSDRSISVKTTRWPLASSFTARLADSISANCDDGIPQRAITISRSPVALRTNRGRVVGEDAGQGWQITDLAIHRPEQPSDCIDVFRHRIEVAHYSILARAAGNAPFDRDLRHCVCGYRDFLDKFPRR